jgi:hypothetical protein
VIQLEDNVVYCTFQGHRGVLNSKIFAKKV